jgi:GDPmannose 4,6-dehydratase
MCFKEAGFGELIWLGEGINEKGYLKRITSPVVEVSPKYFRPYDLTDLIGNAKKVKEEIGWKEEYTLKEIIKDMLTH